MEISRQKSLDTLTEARNLLNLLLVLETNPEKLRSYSNYLASIARLLVTAGEKEQAIEMLPQIPDLFVKGTTLKWLHHTIDDEELQKKIDKEQIVNSAFMNPDQQAEVSSYNEMVDKLFTPTKENRTTENNVLPKTLPELALDALREKNRKRKLNMYKEIIIFALGQTKRTDLDSNQRETLETDISDIINVLLIDNLPKLAEQTYRILTLGNVKLEVLLNFIENAIEKGTPEKIIDNFLEQVENVQSGLTEVTETTTATIYNTKISTALYKQNDALACQLLKEFEETQPPPQMRYVYILMRKIIFYFVSTQRIQEAKDLIDSQDNPEIQALCLIKLAEYILTR